MQCSIPNQKLKSNWLDRLRSSRGFTTADDLDNLDQFLTSNPNPKPNPIVRPPSKVHHEEKDPNLFDLMSTVLSDLFIMGHPAKSPIPQKSSRKQLNPRTLNGSSLLAGNREVSPSSVNNSVAEGKKRKLKVRKKRVSEGVKDFDLSGFSRTEVTVIDTSLSPDWKAARVVYRKGMVWKVREKKVVHVRRKKRRKVGLVEKEEEKKKKKKKKKNVGDVNGEGRKEQSTLLNKESFETDRGEVRKETDDQIPIPIRRTKFSRSPRVPTTKNSSFLRLKVICNGATGPILKGT